MSWWDEFRQYLTEGESPTDSPVIYDENIKSEDVLLELPRLKRDELFLPLNMFVGTGVNIASGYDATKKYLEQVGKNYGYSQPSVMTGEVTPSISSTPGGAFEAEYLAAQDKYAHVREDLNPLAGYRPSTVFEVGGQLLDQGAESVAGGDPFTKQALMTALEAQVGAKFPGQVLKGFDSAAGALKATRAPGEGVFWETAPSGAEGLRPSGEVGMTSRDIPLGVADAVRWAKQNPVKTGVAGLAATYGLLEDGSVDEAAMVPVGLALFNHPKQKVADTSRYIGKLVSERLEAGVPRQEINALVSRTLEQAAKADPELLTVAKDISESYARNGDSPLLGIARDYKEWQKEAEDTVGGYTVDRLVDIQSEPVSYTARLARSMEPETETSQTPVATSATPEALGSIDNMIEAQTAYANSLPIGPDYRAAMSRVAELKQKKTSQERYMTEEDLNSIAWPLVGAGATAAGAYLASDDENAALAAGLGPVFYSKAMRVLEKAPERFEPTEGRKLPDRPERQYTNKKTGEIITIPAEIGKTVGGATALENMISYLETNGVKPAEIDYFKLRDQFSNESTDTVNSLIDEYHAFLKKNNYPEMSADELVKSGAVVTPDHYVYLDSFERRWDTVQALGTSGTQPRGERGERIDRQQVLDYLKANEPDIKTHVFGENVGPQIGDLVEYGNQFDGTGRGVLESINYSAGVANVRPTTVSPETVKRFNELNNRSDLSPEEQTEYSRLYTVIRNNPIQYVDLDKIKQKDPNITAEGSPQFQRWVPDEIKNDIKNYQEMFVTIDGGALVPPNDFIGIRAKVKEYLPNMRIENVSGEDLLKAGASQEFVDEFSRTFNDSEWTESSILDREWTDGHGNYDKVKNPLIRLRFGERVSEGKRQLVLTEIQEPTKPQFRNLPKPLKDKDRLYDIGMKKLVAYAKENGFDEVAWNTGEMISGLYGDALRQVVDEVIYDPQSQKLTVKKNGSTVKEYPDTPKDKIEEYIGKDAAKKLEENKYEERPEKLVQRFTEQQFPTYGAKTAAEDMLADLRRVDREVGRQRRYELMQGADFSSFEIYEIADKQVAKHRISGEQITIDKKWPGKLYGNYLEKGEKVSGTGERFTLEELHEKAAESDVAERILEDTPTDDIVDFLTDSIDDPNYRRYLAQDGVIGSNHETWELITDYIANNPESPVAQEYMGKDWHIDKEVFEGSKFDESAYIPRLLKSLMELDSVDNTEFTLREGKDSVEEIMSILGVGTSSEIKTDKTLNTPKVPVNKNSPDSFELFDVTSTYQMLKKYPDLAKMLLKYGIPAGAVAEYLLNDDETTTSDVLAGATYGLMSKTGQKALKTGEFPRGSYSEILDKQARIPVSEVGAFLKTPNNFRVHDYPVDAINGYKYQQFKNGHSFKLPEILSNDVLFDNYPGADDITIRVDHNLPEGKRAQFQYKNGKSVISLSPVVKDKRGELILERFDTRAIESVLHEVQHFVQHVEEFARGGTPGRFVEYLNKTEADELEKAIDEGDTDTIDFYRSMAGEIYRELLGEEEARRSVEDFKKNKNPQWDKADPFENSDIKNPKRLRLNLREEDVETKQNGAK